jgi:hypothetical protein
LLSRELLGDSVRIFVLLDRDYRADVTIEELQNSLKGSAVHVHVWRRKELESYILAAEAISRASGLSPEISADLLRKAIEDTRVDAQATFIARRQLDSKRGADVKTVALSALPEFEKMWANPSEQIKLVLPKDVLASVAREAHALGGRPVSARSVSAAIKKTELDLEIVDVLLDIEYALNDQD